MSESLLLGQRSNRLQPDSITHTLVKDRQQSENSEVGIYKVCLIKSSKLYKILSYLGTY